MAKDVPNPVAEKFIAAFAEVMKEPATLRISRRTAPKVLPPPPGEKLRDFLVSEGAR